MQMQSQRKFHFGDKENEVEVVVLEIVDPQYGLFTWPSAVILAQYVWYRRNDLKNKNLVELGSGTALPGVLAALCGANITLTDAEKYRSCLENCRKTCVINGLKNIRVTPLTWGSFSKVFLELPTFDIILGSDCFYDPKDFDDVLATIAFLLDRNRKGEFWTSYQERCADWSIETFLMKWKLTSRQVKLSSFEGDNNNISEIDLVGNHAVQLLIITSLN